MQSVMNMMHVISVPYSLMKVNPLSWIQKVCQYKGQVPTPPTPPTPVTHFCPAASQTDEMLTLTVGFIVFPAAKVACVKSRDMHWALVAHKDQKDINLSSLRMLLVADGSNPCKFPLRLYR